jgi:glycosyltransferase involved in cell wall biosynthesis
MHADNEAAEARISAARGRGAGGVRLVLFRRKPARHVFSIEQVFESLEPHLPEDFHVIHAVSSHRSKGLIRRTLSMVEARRRQGDVTHVVGDVNFLALLLDPARTVLSIHDCGLMERAGWLKRWIYLWLWLRLPVRRARLVLVPTEAVRSDLERYVPSAGRKTRVIPNPVAAAFSARPRPFSQEEPVILQVGTRPNKNLERVAQALRGIRCRLVIVGPLTAEQSQILDACSIRYENRVNLSLEEMVACYRDSDLVVFASTQEGFGLPIAEAQATARPVVTSNRQPLRDVAGGAACLVNPLDISSIREGIRRVINDAGYRGQLIRRGLENVRRFQAGAIAERYAAVYQEILVDVPASSSYTARNS